MTGDHHRQVLERESAELGAVPAEQLPVEIDHLGGWTVQTLVGHMGWVMRYVSLALGATPEAPPRRSSVPEPPVGEPVLEWYAEARGGLLEALDRADLDRAVPTFTGAQPGRWWLRRMAHEVAMHHWDLQAAIGSPRPIEAELARDGIDEVFEVFVPARLDLDRLAGSGETLHLHATDLDGEWFCTLGAEAVTWRHAHDKGDVAVRGRTSDLLLLLWSRIPPSRLELFGNAEILDRWQRAAAF